MKWPDGGPPTPMARVAFVAPESRLRWMLTVIADSGVVQLVNPLPGPQGEAVEALRRMERDTPHAPGAAGPLKLADQAKPVGELERLGRRDLLAGEVELARRAESAVRRAGFACLVGWVPAADLPALTTRLAADGAAAVVLERPRFVEPPTLLRPAGGFRRFGPLVSTYGATRYADLDPTPFAAVSVVVMFGMMFGDVGHGLLLSGLGLLLWRSTNPRFAGVRPLWPFAVAGGLTAAIFGALYGEFFGPTGVLPAIWLKPLEEPMQLLGVAVAVGALLLTCSYGIGITNRMREAGFGAALLAPSGVAGLAVFAGVGLAGLAVYLDLGALLIAAAGVAVLGVLLLLAGFIAEAGFSGAAIAQSVVEVLDAVMRVASNLVSFTRLAAFGLMHAALGLVVLDAGRSLWDAGPAGPVAAAVVVVVGGAAAFALEVLVAGVQAMRLEYYELFSRIYSGEGEPFSPWNIAVEREEPT